MKLSSFAYLVKSGIRSIKINKLMSLASVAVLTACFVLVGFIWLINTNIPHMMGYIEGQNEIVAYLKDEVSENSYPAITEEIESISGVKKVSLLNKEEVLNSQREIYGDLIDTLPSNPFPATYHISVKDISKVKSISEKISTITGIEKVDAPTEVADTLSGLENTITTIGLLVMIILITVSVVIIANTVRLTVFGRRKEINIMKYVGATNSFIRLPFIVEGATLGIISSILSFGILWGIYTITINSVVSVGTGSWFAAIAANIIPFEAVSAQIIFAFLISGILTGALGSFISIRKHLKV